MDPRLEVPLDVVGRMSAVSGPLWRCDMGVQAAVATTILSNTVQMGWMEPGGACPPSPSAGACHAREGPASCSRQAAAQHVPQPRSAPAGTGTARISPGAIQRKNATNQRRASLRPGILSNIAQALSATRNGSTGRGAGRPPCVSRVRKADCSRTRASSDGPGMPARGCCRLLGRSRPVVLSPWACDTD